MRFLHVSDLHFKKRYREKGIEAVLSQMGNAEENFVQCFAKEKAKGIDFVLLTGDIVHEGSHEEYQSFFQFMKETLGNVPYYIVPGNHDKREAISDLMAWPMKEEKLQDKVIDLDGIQLILLDSGSSINGSISKEQTEWLSRHLTRKISIIALHHPLVEKQWDLPPAEFPSTFLQVLSENQSSIKGIFCGHTHIHYQSVIQGVPYYTADSLSYSMIDSESETSFCSLAGYEVVEYKEENITVQTRQLSLKDPVTMSFSSDRLTQLFKE